MRFIWAYNQRSARSEQIIGRTDADLFTPEEAAHLVAVKRRVLEEGVEVREQRWLDRPTGRMFLDVYFEPIRGTDGLPVGVATATVDLTPIKVAEDRLRESEERYATIFSESPVAIALSKMPGPVTVSVNTAFLELFEYTAEEVVGKTAVSLGIADSESQARVGTELAEKGRVRAFEAVRRTRSGALQFISLNVDWVAIGGERLLLTTVQDVTDRRTAEERLRRELREKEVLLKEVHHRVKNNLQVICSLVALQADHSGDVGIRAILQDVAYRVRSMALVHESLYRSLDLAHVDFAGYVGRLVEYLWRGHGAAAAAVRLDLAVEPVALPVDLAVPCGLILNELAGNALKHAFPDGAAGTVSVTLRRDAGRVRLCVRDDGVGMPADLDWREARSLGLRLVQLLSGQLEATVELVGDTGRGTAFEIAFPLPAGAPE